MTNNEPNCACRKGYIKGTATESCIGKMLTFIISKKLKFKFETIYKYEYNFLCFPFCLDFVKLLLYIVLALLFVNGM